jgi:hypothetical protein
MAVSVELLAFYQALFERSCDAVNALSHALHSHYTRRGFRMTDKNVSLPFLLDMLRLTGTQGSSIQDPFWLSLGRAIQWFDILQVELDRRLDNVVSDCQQHITNHLSAESNNTPVKSDVGRSQSPDFWPHQTPSQQRVPDTDNSTTSNSNVIPDTRRSGPCPTPPACDKLLIQRCPACFRGNKFGRTLKDGADIHVATDGNFHHRHRRSAGDAPILYTPQFFLPKAQVDAAGKRIEQARKRPVRLREVRVPDEAVDHCESSHKAADGKKQKASMDKFDDSGFMVLKCRHDIPLFFANIDTPGEQQKYSIALIKHLFSLLPPQATVVVLYDIGCVVERSITKVRPWPYATTTKGTPFPLLKQSYSFNHMIV